MREIINDAILQPFTHKISLAETFSSSVVYNDLGSPYSVEKLLLNESLYSVIRSLTLQNPSPHAKCQGGDCLILDDVLPSLMPNIKEMHDVV